MTVGVFFHQTLLFTFKTSMAQFSDLKDKLALEVLDWLTPKELFKFLCVNRHFNRVAAKKLRGKVKAIQFTRTNRFFLPKCACFGLITHDQVLTLGQKFENLYDPSTRALLLKVLTKCAGLKYISFGYLNFPKTILIDVFQRCPQVNCFKFDLLVKKFELREWKQVLYRIGHKIIHLQVTVSCYKPQTAGVNLSHLQVNPQMFIKTVASKCPNIKQFTLILEHESLTSDWLAAFKMLPKNCLVTLDCYSITEPFLFFKTKTKIDLDFQDVVDDLRVKTLIWPALAQRLDRLSSLKCEKLAHKGPDFGVEFAGLKKFEFTDPLTKLEKFNSLLFNQTQFRQLIASRFPLLEEFCFNVVCFTEDEYDRLFQKMPSLKKLTILYDYDSKHDLYSQLPQSAIHHLIKLDTIAVEILNVHRRWTTEHFIKQLEHYVDEVIFLKKLTVDTKGLVGKKRKQEVQSEVKRLKLKLEQFQSKPTQWTRSLLTVNTSNARLDVLDDDCLMQVLDRLPTQKLFKMLRVNKRMNRLATVKLQVKVKAIRICEFGYNTKDCNHFGAISKNEALFIESMYQDIFDETLRRSFFLSLLTKCTSVKSIEFLRCKLTSDILLEVVRCCPELECIKLDSNVEEEDWNQFMYEIGERVVHIAIESYYNSQTEEARLFQTINLKCTNITQIDWLLRKHLTKDVVEAIKMLPKSCRIKLNCDDIEGQRTSEMFKVVDELRVRGTLDCSLLGGRIDRLSNLTFFTAKNWIQSVDFAGLEKFNFKGIKKINDSFKFLLVCQFPRLREFRFNAGAGFDEADYEVLFSGMASVKKLVIKYQDTKQLKIHDYEFYLDPRLPRSSIRRLKNLETIILNVCDLPGEVQDFVQPIEGYVDEISWLKKITIDMNRLSDDNQWYVWAESVKEKVEQMKQKQSRVQIELID